MITHGDRKARLKDHSLWPGSGLGVFLSELVPSPGSSIGCSGQQLVLQAVLRHVGGMRGGTDADPWGFTGSIRETQR